MEYTLAMLLYLLAACCFGSPAAVESFVAVPDTVEAAQALHAPPDVVVNVARVTKESGGGACGHSPVCLVLLPIIVWQAVFPEKVDAIGITEGGTPTVTGEWETDGDLIWAERRDGSTVRAARLLNLEALDRRIVVVAATATVDAGGVTSAYTPVTVQSQVDLVGAYEKKLSTTSGTHANLLTEEVAALGVEAMSAVAAHMSDPQEEEDARAAVLQSVCMGSDPQGDALLLRTTFLRAASQATRPVDARIGLTCALAATSPDAFAARAFLRALVEDVCANVDTDSLTALRDAVGQYPQVGMIGSDFVHACPTRAPRVLLGRTLGLATPDLAGAVLDDNRAVYFILEGLDASKPDDRAALFSRLSQPKPETKVIVERLENAPETRATLTEAEIIAAAYLAESPGMLGGRQPQARLLAQLSLVPLENADGARRVLATAHAEADDKQRPVAAAGLLVLGERARAVDAARGLTRGMGYAEPGSVIGIDQLTAWALVDSGCKAEELEEARVKAAALPVDAVDPLCTRG